MIIMSLKKSLLFLSLLLPVLGMAQSTTVTYTVSDEHLVNPERGFYRYTATYGSAPNPLTEEELNEYHAEGLSLIFRYFFLDSFLNSPISDDFLTSIENDFAVMRSAGFKVIARFAYTETLPEDPPYNDSPELALLLQHIDQLKSIIQANDDVILTLQNGFWGVWGENYYSDEFGSEEDVPLTAQNWADRKMVTDSLLAILPESRLLSLRYPELKSAFYGFNIPADSLTMAEAHNGSIKSRLGYHNDCFLVAANDYTFGNTATEKPYWETESRYTIMGGESCGDNPTYTNCSNALNDLENAHWTYLNDYYHPEVLDRWEQEGCLEEVSRRLGYRLYLTEGTYQIQAMAGGMFSLFLEMHNDGFAGPVNEREVYLIFKNGGQKYAFLLPVDVREWYGSGIYNIDQNIVLPADMEAGDYDLYLSFPDAAAALAEDERYAIQLANEDMWDADSGYNDLNMTVSVSPVNGTAAAGEAEECAVLQQDRGGRCTVKTALANYRLQLANVAGQQMVVYSSLSGEFTLDLSALPRGIYVVHLRAENGCERIWKVGR